MITSWRFCIRMEVGIVLFFTVLHIICTVAWAMLERGYWNDGESSRPGISHPAPQNPGPCSSYQGRTVHSGYTRARMPGMQISHATIMQHYVRVLPPLTSTVELEQLLQEEPTMISRSTPSVTPLRVALCWEGRTSCCWKCTVLQCGMNVWMSMYACVTISLLTCTTPCTHCIPIAWQLLCS